MHEKKTPPPSHNACAASPDPTDAGRVTSSDAGVNVLPHEVALDGVRYVDLRHDGQDWRLAGVNPLWRQDIVGLGTKPDATALAALEARGMWLAPAAPAVPLAVMCCGLGSAWAGMGRELYDNFPAARAGMDRIAAVADWDVLALMDETDVEKINHIRWQIPYLFLLEYAQWSQLCSLGLAPSLICGHSLGEPIALCLAGIVEPEVAWYILDTRAIHMAELEARATRETGMLAVHAGLEVIEEARATWPALYISNYNTPRQFILSGPREVLMEARASLRKRRIPVIMLNIGMAFHHPSMRVLRDLSLRRLNALEMRAPRLPLLSGISADFYPPDQPSICRCIADLDENSVLWVDDVRAMWARDGIRQFLELGPQDTLCSLVGDIEPQALCLSAGRKGKETEGMRQACARLYTLGHLPRAAVCAAAQERTTSGVEGGHSPHLAAEAAHVGRGVAAGAESGGMAGVDPEQMAIVLDVLARATGRPVESLRWDMDLRYDLALRSSRFPLIIQEAEQRLGQSVNFEALLQVATIGDLARVLTGCAGGPAREAAQPRADGRRPGAAQLYALHGGPAPLLRFTPFPPGAEKAAGTAPCASVEALDPCGAGLPLRRGDVVALCIFDPQLLPGLWSGLAPLGCTLAVPPALREACAPLARAGARLITLPLGKAETADAEDLHAAFSQLAAAEGRVDGVFFAPAPGGDEAAVRLLEACLRSAQGHGLRYACCFRRTPLTAAAVHTFFAATPQPDALAAYLEKWACEKAFDWRSIVLLDDGQQGGAHELGDMLARELTHGDSQRIIWCRKAALCPDAPPRGPRLKEKAEVFPLVFPDPQPPLEDTATLFQGACHFSRFADPALSAHGGRSPRNAEATAPWLPVSRALQAMLEGAHMFLPWLTVTGLSDVRFHEMPLLPPGITRECRLSVEARPWLMHDRVMTRMCHTDLAVRQLAGNGRHTDAYAPVAGGMALLAADAGEVPPLWPVSAQSAWQCDNTGLEKLADFYDILGLAAPWRLLSAFAALPDEMFHAGLAAPEEAIAPGSNWGYVGNLHMVEGIVQAALLALAGKWGAPAGAESADKENMTAALQRWRLNAAGYVRFGKERGAQGPKLLQLRRSWADGRLLRFDAQVSDTLGHVLLTLHHLEFDRLDATASAEEPTSGPAQQP